MPIETPEEFENWLKDQSQETCVLIAARAALRVFPIVTHSDAQTDAIRNLALLTARAILTSGVAGKMPTPEVNARAAADAARAAYAAYAVDAAAGSAGAAYAAADAADAADAAGAARAAARAAADAARAARAAADAAADAADAAGAAARAAAYADSSLDFGALFSEPLWHSPGEPGWLVSALSADDNVLESGPEWAFWRDWYQGFLDGNPLDWELQRRVALITDAIWEAGPEAVAEEIERIKAEWLAEKLPQAEEISRDPDDGLFTVSNVVVVADEMIDRLFSQLDFSLELALRGHNTSGFSEMCIAYRYLEHTRDNCRDDPNAVHMHIRLARELIEGKLKSGEYQSEDGLSALATAMERHEVQLRADHPVIRKAHETFVAQRLRELDEERRLQIAQSFRSLQPESKGRLEAEYGLDAETLETDAGAEAHADAVKRSGGRSQKMSLIERTGSAIKAADGSAANKATGMMFKLQKLAELLSGLF